MEYSKRSIIFDICIMLLSISVIIILAFNLATNIKQSKNNSNTTNNIISYDIALKDYECKDEYKANTFVIQSMEELSYVIQTKKDLTLFIGRSSCKDCQREYPIIAEQYYNKGEILYYFNPEPYKKYEVVDDKLMINDIYYSLLKYLIYTTNDYLTINNTNDLVEYDLPDTIGTEIKQREIENKKYYWIYVPTICYIVDGNIQSFEIKG